MLSIQVTLDSTCQTYLRQCNLCTHPLPGLRSFQAPAVSHGAGRILGRPPAEAPVAVERLSCPVGRPSAAQDCAGERRRSAPVRRGVPDPEAADPGGTGRGAAAAHRGHAAGEDVDRRLRAVLRLHAGADRQLREGLLVTVLDDYTDRSGPLRVLWPSSRHLAPKLRVFVDFLVANLGPAVEGESDKAGDSRISS